MPPRSTCQWKYNGQTHSVSHTVISTHIKKFFFLLSSRNTVHPLNNENVVWNELGIFLWTQGVSVWDEVRKGCWNITSYFLYDHFYSPALLHCSTAMRKLYEERQVKKKHFFRRCIFNLLRIVAFVALFFSNVPWLDFYDLFSEIKLACFFKQRRGK